GPRRPSRDRAWRRVPRPLRLGGVPRAVEEAIAGGVARLLVLDPAIERPALIGPLRAAIVALHHGIVTHGMGAGIGHQRRPVLGAAAIAVGLAGRVLVEDIE